MITYELAKKLKDAGFPQKEVTPSMVREAMDYEEDDVVTYPTLSELIEACGERFGSLRRIYIPPAELTWFLHSSAIPNELDIEHHIVVQGSTPDEAVAKLYLGLKKKQ